MLKKWMVVFLAAALLGCPAAAEETGEWKVDVWGDAAEESFTVAAGIDAAVSCVSDTVLENSTGKIKISHPEESATAETTTVITFKYKHGETKDETMSAGYYLSFFLEELSAGEGVKLSVKPNQNREPIATEFFDDTSYSKWRKAMVYTVSDVFPEPEFTVTFKGVGTVYLDDFQAEITSYVINGNFEGVAGDGKFAGDPRVTVDTDAGEQYTSLWKHPTSTTYPNCQFKNIKPNQTLSEDELAAIAQENGGNIGQWYFVETNEGNYLMSVGSNNSIKYDPGVGTCDLTDGQSYRAVISNKAAYSKNGTKFEISMGAITPTPRRTTGTGYCWTAYSENWTDKSTVFVYQFGGSKLGEKRLEIGFGGNNSNRTTIGTTDTFCYFDDFRVEEVKETAKLQKEDGKAVSGIPLNETVTVSFEKPLLDMTADKDEGGTTVVEARTHGYETAASVTAVAALYRKNGANLQLESVQLAPALRGTTHSGGTYADSTDSPFEFGYLPASESFDIAVPSEGEFEIRLFLWDAAEKMNPAGEKVYTFTTASAQ